MICRVAKFTFSEEYWPRSRGRDEYVWTGPSPARAAFTQTMGCRCGSGPGPDEENEIARAGWGVEVRWAQTGGLLWDPVAEGHCSAEEKHNNNKNKKNNSSWIFLYDYEENNWVGGIRHFEDIERSLSLETRNDPFTPHSGTRAGK